MINQCKIRNVIRLMGFKPLRSRADWLVFRAGVKGPLFEIVNHGYYISVNPLHPERVTDTAASIVAHVLERIHFKTGGVWLSGDGATHAIELRHPYPVPTGFKVEREYPVVEAKETRKPRCELDGSVKKVRYRRKATPEELKAGHGAVTYKEFPISECCHPDTRIPRKWLRDAEDGLRYDYF